jgi:hypothetical protein
MRLSRLFLALTVFSALSLNPALCPTPAAAQQIPTAPSSLPCTGNVNIVRLSDVKPGMMDKFLKATAAQQAWYKNAGLPDQVGVMRIMERNPDTKAYAVSETQAITTHIIPPRRQLASGAGRSLEGLRRHVQRQLHHQDPVHDLHGSLATPQHHPAAIPSFA